MAYNTSEEYKNVIYSGQSEYELYVEYGNEVLEDASSHISSLKGSRRLLANGNKYFSLDNFISQTADLTMFDINIEDTTKEFYFKLGTLIDDSNYENIPIGYFKIKDNPTTTNGKTTYKLIDRSTNFDFNYDSSELINANGGSATLLQIVQNICSQAKVELATTSFPRNQEKVSFYDSTLTGRQHISFIAEKCGCIATIGRDGKLHFIPIVKENNNAKEIPEEIYNQNMVISDKYKISRVSFDSGTILWTRGDDTGDTLYINSANLYITKEEDVEYIYNSVKDFEIYSINSNNIMGDLSIDPWDFIKYKMTDEDENVTNEVIGLGQYDYTFNGTITQNFETTIDRLAKNKNKTLNSTNTRIKRLTQTIDETNASLKIVSEQTDENSSQIGSLSVANNNLTIQVSNVEKGLNTTNSTLQQTNQNVTNLQTQINGVSADFEDFKDNEYMQTIENIQNQLDGAIQFWYGEEVPTLNNYPANEWTTEELKREHEADIYTITSGTQQGNSYRFAKIDNVWQWLELTDTEISAVRELAQQALDKANKNATDINTLKQTDTEIKADINGINLKYDTLNNDYQANLTTRKSVSGNPTYISDSGGYALEKDFIYGMSIQETRSGKNLFDYRNLKTNTSSAGITSTLNEDGSITISGIPTSNYTSIVVGKDITDMLEDGVTYTMSQTSKNNSFYMQMLQTKISDGSKTYNHLMASNYRSFTVDKSLYTYYIGAQIGTMADWGTESKTITQHFQLEKGSTPTEFEQYGAMPSPEFPSEITNNKGIENLIRLTKGTTQTKNGITYSVDENFVITLNGTCNANNTTFGFDNNLKDNSLNGYYTASYEYLGGSISGVTSGTNIQIQRNTDWTGVFLNLGASNKSTSKTLEGNYRQWVIRCDNGVVFDNYKIKVQLEKGSIAHTPVPYGSNYLVQKICGKQLFNKNNVASGYFNSSGSIVNSGSWYHQYIKVQPDENYVISGVETSNSTSQVVAYDKDMNFIQRIMSYRNGTFATNENIAYIGVSVLNTDLGTYQFEKDTKTEYEPYKETLITYDLQGNELCKNGDTKDNVELVSGVLTKKIKERIFDGTESWTYASNSSYFYLSMSDLKINAIVKSNYYTSIAFADGYNKRVDYGITGNNTYSRLCIRNKDITSLADWKTYLQELNANGNPLKIQYESIEPETIQLEPTEIKLYEGINNIYTESNVDVEEVDITYLTDSVLNGQYATKSELQITEDRIQSTVSSTTTVLTNNISSVDTKVTESTNNLQNQINTTNNNLSTTNTNVTNLATDLNQTNLDLDNTNTTLNKTTNNLQSQISENKNTNKDLQNQLNDTNANFNNYATNSTVTTIRNSVANIQTSLNQQILITKEIQENGVSKVKTSTNYTFDEDGLNIEKSDQSNKATIDNNGVEVTSNNGSTRTFFAGYDEDIGASVVESDNMYVKDHLVMMEHVRSEAYTDSTTSKTGVGFFWIG